MILPKIEFLIIISRIIDLVLGHIRVFVRNQVDHAEDGHNYDENFLHKC